MGSDGTEAADGPVVATDVRGRVLVVTLGRPERRNAIDAAVAHSIEAAIDRLECDESLWAAVLTGAGGMFSAGADLAAGTTGERLSTDRGGFAGFVRRARRKPVVAAVEGYALGGGLEIALACDLIVAARDATLGLPEVTRGLIASAGGLIRLPRRVPLGVAMEVAMTGERLPARRAYDLGLVNLLTEPGEALAGALGLAEKIVANAPLAVQASREVMLEASGEPEETAWKLSRAARRRLAETEDFREGPRAFLEKRPPRWSGR